MVRLVNSNLAAGAQAELVMRQDTKSKIIKLAIRIPFIFPLLGAIIVMDITDL
jgi:hypothetical protein